MRQHRQHPQGAVRQRQSEVLGGVARCPAPAVEPVRLPRRPARQPRRRLCSAPPEAWTRCVPRANPAVIE